jgi:hypothetical protein
LTTDYLLVSICSVKVRLGEYDLRTDVDCGSEKGPLKGACTTHLDVDVDKIIVHPEYTQHRFKGAKNDIALIRLKQDVNDTNGWYSFISTHYVPTFFPP